jgi:transglutaminase-like putative cysteine protease
LLTPPRRLTVRHLTRYRYSEPVRLGEHRMMFRPRESHDLRLIHTQLEITPQPHTMRWLHDVFDNSVAIVTFDTATTELRFDSVVTLEHTETNLPDYPLEIDARTYPFAYSAEDGPDLIRALERYCPSEIILAWARRFITEDSTDTIGLLRRITWGIRDELTYSRRTERGVQSPDETLRLGRGTCRDFAWLMIEAARALGFAARFVSGYIFVPEDDGVAYDGGGSTHAWLQIYLPGAGWVDFDPTNSIIGNRNLIRVAVAWTPAQVLPLWGSYFGRRDAFRGMDVSVSVRDETALP